MKLNIKILTAVTAIVLFVGNTAAQQVNTVYFMRSVPERVFYNPAFQPIHDIWVDLPILPNFRIGIELPTAAGDIFFNKTIDGAEKTVTFLHPQATSSERNKFYNNLSKSGRTSLDATLNILAFGFRSGKGYFTFDMLQRADANFYLPKSLFDLMLNGTGESSSFDLKQTGIDATLYMEIGLGYSRKIDEKLMVGAKLKYLIGEANISNNFKKLELNAGIDKWTLSGSGTLNMSMPYMEVEYKDVDNKQVLDRLNTDGFDNFKVSDIPNRMFTSNWGLGLDLGATYQLLPELQLSASITDLGFILWNQNIKRMSATEEYLFDGVEYVVGDDLSTVTDKIGDEFGNFSNILTKEESEGYSTALTTRVNLGAEYSILDDKIGFGLLSTTMFARKTVFTDLTASVNFRPVDWFTPTLSYSLFNGRFSSIGLGLQLKFAIFDMYLAVDRLPFKMISQYYLPANLNGTTLQAGLVWALRNPNRRDDDRDGVRNGKDKCPNTPLGFLVDKYGCTVDSDGDGVPDNLDKCPNTPSGVEVDIFGCPLDEDGDGVPDYKDRCPKTPKGVAVDEYGCTLDDDGDGVPNSLDDCPDTQKNIEVDEHGCPRDGDSDGVPDYLDKCPSTPPEARATVDEHGCSLDSDGDGVPDYIDQCPNTPSAARGQVDEKGCELDSDGDGVPDYIDDCPRLAGLPEKRGCPEVKSEVKKVFEKALRGIQFETGKAVIKPASFGILNQIVNIMFENPAYLLYISGHTDNVGKPASNQVLSEKRAQSVKDYLVTHGVDVRRLYSQGFGDTQPVDTNKTAAGRAKNRRVEFSVHFTEVETKVLN